MWQRFTERARRVILWAQEEAGKMNSAHVGTEHLLLGLMRENEGVGAQILQKMGVNLQKVRSEMEAEVQSSEVAGASEPKLTPKAKRVLEMAADEARRLRHNYIGTEHLLLALLREKDGLAAKVLRKLGLNLEEARTYVLDYLGSEAHVLSHEPKFSDPLKRLTPKAQFVFALAINEAQRMNQNAAAPEHFLLALLHENDGIATQILSEAGLDLEKARKRVLELRG